MEETSKDNSKREKGAKVEYKRVLESYLLYIAVIQLTIIYKFSIWAIGETKKSHPKLLLKLL